MAATDFKDYYSILGVSKTANADEIKKAFRRLARQYHPDMNPGDRNARPASRKSVKPTRFSQTPTSANNTIASGNIGNRLETEPVAVGGLALPKAAPQRAALTLISVNMRISMSFSNPSSEG